MAVDSAQEIKTKKKSSKKAEKAATEPILDTDSNAVKEEVKEKKKKSRAKKEEQPLESEIDTTQPDETEPPVSDKKRKKRKRAAESEDKEPAAPAPPQKKHKNRTEFADPRVDETLSNQARKGLEYAFLQMNKPAKWKFNKARQNWLIRNIWSLENIPEVYMPLLCKYLVDVKGGSREKLKASCQSVLNPEEPTKEEEPSAPVESPSPSKRKVTFGPLIAAPTPAPAPAELSGEPAAVSPATADAKKLAEINRSRAQMILDILQ